MHVPNVFGKQHQNEQLCFCPRQSVWGDDHKRGIGSDGMCQCVGDFRRRKCSRSPFECDNLSSFLTIILHRLVSTPNNKARHESAVIRSSFSVSVFYFILISFNQMSIVIFIGKVKFIGDGVETITGGERGRGLIST